MKNLFLPVIFLLLAMSFANCSEVGNMLAMVDCGKLAVVHSDGTQELISEGTGGGVFSPDRQAVVFTVSHKLL